MERNTSVAGRNKKISLIFGGFLPVSMLDWEGKLATVFFTAGCNFRCPFCHNPELVKDVENLIPFDWDDLYSHLKTRQGWLDGVVVGGGEPTIHPELPFYLKEIKKLGYLVKLDTNGSNPSMIQELIKECLVDFIAMDIKTGFDHYNEATSVFSPIKKIKQSIKIIINSGVKHEFRTTVVPGLVDRQDLLNIAREIQGTSCYVLQQFNPKNTLDEKLSIIKPYPEETLLDWQNEVNKIAPTQVRGVS